MSLVILSAACNLIHLIPLFCELNNFFLVIDSINFLFQLKLKIDICDIIGTMKIYVFNPSRII
jgi:hypothetical protein